MSKAFKVQLLNTYTGKVELDSVSYPERSYARDKIQRLMCIKHFKEFKIIEVDVIQFTDIQIIVHESLDKAVENGIDPRKNPNSESWAKGLITSIPNLEDCSVEQVEVHVKDWLKNHPLPNPLVWQPIETAPKDGTVIIIYPAWYRKKVLSAGEAYWYTSVRHSKWKSQNLSIPCEPTHWMPFPPGPKPEL